MNTYRESIHKNRCYRACLYTQPSNNNRWHGYIRSAPAHQTPGKMFCGEGQVFGQCPEDELHVPESLGFEAIRVYPSA